MRFSLSVKGFALKEKRFSFKETLRSFTEKVAGFKAMRFSFKKTAEDLKEKAGNPLLIFGNAKRLRKNFIASQLSVFSFKETLSAC